MTITNTMQRQPTKFDYASPTQFKFQIQKLPKVEYFTTACNIPGISLNATVQPTPLADIPLPGDTISFGDLEITFLVDENLENYREVKYGAQGLGPIFSDATLNVLTSKNNANIEVRFNNVFPISLSGLNFNQQANDIDYLTATVSFKYKLYEFALKGGSRTTNTVT